MPKAGFEEHRLLSFERKALVTLPENVTFIPIYLLVSFFIQASANLLDNRTRLVWGFHSLLAPHPHAPHGLLLRLGIRFATGSFQPQRPVYPTVLRARCSSDFENSWVNTSCFLRWLLLNILLIRSKTSSADTSL